MKIVYVLRPLAHHGMNSMSSERQVKPSLCKADSLLKYTEVFMGLHWSL